jgi:hypothetical protein
MNTRDDDRLDRLLAGLTPLPPNPTRAARTRERCRSSLTRADWRSRAVAAVMPSGHRSVEPMAAVLAATVFLGNVLIRALQLYGVLPAP